MKKLFVPILILFASLMCGCNYPSIISLPEQIAIYQNQGFILAPLSQDITVGQNVVQINTIDNINSYLTKQGESCQVNNGIALYLPSEDKQTLKGLIYVYYFNSPQGAKAFYNFFKKTYDANLYLYKQAVIQKGENSLVISSANNTYYYSKFTSSLKG